MFLIPLLAQRDGLTIREILSSIPHDPAAAIGYLLVIVFGLIIWWGSRRTSGRAIGPRGASSAVPPSSQRKDPE